MSYYSKRVNKFNCVICGQKASSRDQDRQICRKCQDWRKAGPGQKQIFAVDNVQNIC
jgi:hypothetical protein